MTAGTTGLERCRRDSGLVFYARRPRRAWVNDGSRTVYRFEAKPGPPPRLSDNGRTQPPRLVSAGRTGTRTASIEECSHPRNSVSSQPTPGTQGAALQGLRFAVIGAGRLGTSLALALNACGAQLTAYTCLTESGRARAQSYLGVVAASSVSEVITTAPEWYFLSVPDAALADVAAELGGLLAARSALPRKAVTTPQFFVAHTSGVSSVELLRPCAEAGAGAVAFHPLQTFSDPHRGSTRFVGAAAAITPLSDQHAAETAAAGFHVAEGLGMRPFLLEDHKRSLYHAAACIASNYLVTLEHFAERLFVESGMPRDEAIALFLPLAQASLDNVAAQGPLAALTGPLSRGDVRTIADHLQALGRDAPDVLPLYRCLGTATLELVRQRAEVDHTTLLTLAELLIDPGPSGKT